jgi:hypothetical protein
MHWNFNMDEAPKGEMKLVKFGKNEREIHVPKKIIATDGHIVTVSNWLPPQDYRPVGRWNMFNADSPPIAWMPWPEAPVGKIQNGCENEN